MRQLLFGARTETIEAVVGTKDATPETGTASEAQPKSDAQEREVSDTKPARKGHGRNGAEAYKGATQIDVPHPTLQPGDACPECAQGTVYENRPGLIVRITGGPPLAAKVYRLQKLRCHLCGQIFTAPAPAEVGPRKYDATAGSMIGLLKYGSGLPFNRLEGLQGDLEVPLPASTQWEIVRDVAARLTPAFEDLVRQAAQGEVVHNDDTTIKILALMRSRAQAGAEGDAEARTGLFTSGVVSLHDSHRVALFFSGPEHAGENLARVLKHRAEELPPPIQMCDALSRNLPGELRTIVGHCLAHARRRFVEIHDRFPEPCVHLLESLAVVYRHDEEARAQKLSPEARLRFHQEQSGPTMEALHAWLKRQFDDKRVEPNSALGCAISYMLKHWDRLTLFLRQPGAPLDNNVCERALKKAILHRKNALFYRTLNGARVGDLFMSLIHTCELNQVNPFDYLTQLQRHAEAVALAPDRWMPWNYRETRSEA